MRNGWAHIWALATVTLSAVVGSVTLDLVLSQPTVGDLPGYQSHAVMVVAATTILSLSPAVLAFWRGRIFRWLAGVLLVVDVAWVALGFNGLGLFFLPILTGGLAQPLW
ncbi:MAG: hypothetical protein ACYCOR_15560 [Acidobacteriaceae bacterium]